MNLNYTYTVKSINIEQGTMVIDYVPEDLELSPMSLNAMLYEKNYFDIRDENNQLIYQNQNDVPFSVHIDHTIKSCAPINVWRKQKFLLDNYNDVHNMTGSVNL